jgi:hypothetical protein
MAIVHAGIYAELVYRNGRIAASIHQLDSRRNGTRFAVASTITGCGNVDLTRQVKSTFVPLRCQPLLALLLLLLATRDAHARQGGSDKDDRKHDIAILKSDDEGFLVQILAQHCLCLGVQEFSYVASAS